MCLLHHMFLKTGVTPDEFFKKDKWVQDFMLASIRIYVNSNKGGELDDV